MIKRRYIAFHFGGSVIGETRKWNRRTGGSAMETTSSSSSIEKEEGEGEEWRERICERRGEEEERGKMEGLLWR